MGVRIAGRYSEVSRARYILHLCRIDLALQVQWSLKNSYSCDSVTFLGRAENPGGYYLIREWIVPVLQHDVVRPIQPYHVHLSFSNLDDRAEQTLIDSSQLPSWPSSSSSFSSSPFTYRCRSLGCGSWVREWGRNTGAWPTDSRFSGR